MATDRHTSTFLLKFFFKLATFQSDDGMSADIILEKQKCRLRLAK